MEWGGGTKFVSDGAPQEGGENLNKGLCQPLIGSYSARNFHRAQSLRSASSVTRLTTVAGIICINKVVPSLTAGRMFSERIR
jgi:hypothetical protein